MFVSLRGPVTALCASSIARAPDVSISLGCLAGLGYTAQSFRSMGVVKAGRIDVLDLRYSYILNTNQPSLIMLNKNEGLF